MCASVELHSLRWLHVHMAQIVFSVCVCARYLQTDPSPLIIHMCVRYLQTDPSPLIIHMCVRTLVGASAANPEAAKKKNYVDPRNYASTYDALVEFAKEIPPHEMNLQNVIGSG